ncbi:response regulator [Paenibacillus rhizovicinus]|uniref:Response regulator n=1 Tax=Paenibacillus rhizovicinus TaxID=2704463 RepID=A0A6C0P4G2_9BACL|nr:response regulator [Paenibacillus rhizovicinus]QHW33440.1 response regulator [Paenibacillus rhizovicinus]
MLTMIIADDEYNVREGLKEVVRWEELGIQVIGDAADGQEAVERCRELKPDILLTDIRMPLMDGLEAAIKLRELGNPVRLIIISGAEDFNYAKTALSLNADGYILKPIKIAELQQTLRKVVASILAERGREAQTEQLQQQLHQNMPVLREKFLTQLTLGMMKDEESVRQKMTYFALPFTTEGPWTAAVLQIDDYEKAVERYSGTNKQLLSFSVNNLLEEIVSRSGSCVTFFMNENEHVILFSSAARDDRSPMNVCREMIQCVHSFLQLPSSCGIGNPVRNATDIYNSYQEALAAIKYRFYTGKNSVLSIGDFQSDDRSVEFPQLFDAEQDLLRLIKLGDSEQAAAKIRFIFNTLCDNRRLPVGYVQSVCAELVNVAGKAVLELDENIRHIVPDYSSVFHDIYGKREAAELQEVMLAFFGKLTAHFALKHSQKNARTIHKIKTIIEQTYMNHISLTKLAEEVYLSPNYISLIFKQETGESITEYITKVRMEAAMELLKSPDLKILEVSEMVGFENATYFSTVFKKYAGMHPQKHRSLYLNE